MLASMLLVYGAWQYCVSLNSTGSVLSLSLEDINQFRGEVIVLHFMFVDCGGEIAPVNDQQLMQLSTLCMEYCGNRPVAVVTVAVATCPDSDLAEIRANHNITWIFGNDYGDGKMDVVNAYKEYSIEDGAVVLIDKSLNVAQVYNEAITADTLSSRIDQLLEA